VSNPFTIRRTRLHSGERNALLVDVATGIPLPDPTLYMLQRLRTKNLAVNSIEAHLRAIMILELILRARKICLAERASQGKSLSLAEIELIVATCKSPLSKIVAQFGKVEETSHKTTIHIDSLRLPLKNSKEESISSYRDRITYIRNYLDDFAERMMDVRAENSDTFLRLETARSRMYKAFTTRIPSRREKAIRTALNSEQISTLWNILEPTSSLNPFSMEFVRHRNFLMVQWFVLLGLRRGELLGIRIEDICWQTKTVRIERRQDSPSDPRIKEACAKTTGGEIPLSDELLASTHEYLTNPSLRPKYATGGHTILFISMRGVPLSNTGLNNIFEGLRGGCNIFPVDFNAQLCRHTTNDILSRGFDEQGVSSHDEAARRRSLMRWTPNSKMPDHYNQRRIAEKASESSKKAQVSDFAGRVKK
jgi:integrase